VVSPLMKWTFLSSVGNSVDTSEFINELGITCRLTSLEP
jgi:hypothetical protein